jgi:hypothetical protein
MGAGGWVGNRETGKAVPFHPQPQSLALGNGFMQVICPAHMNMCVTLNKGSSLIHSWIPICK